MSKYRPSRRSYRIRMRWWEEGEERASSQPRSLSDMADHGSRPHQEGVIVGTVKGFPSEAADLLLFFFEVCTGMLAKFIVLSAPDTQTVVASSLGGSLLEVFSRIFFLFDLLAKVARCPDQSDAQWQYTCRWARLRVRDSQNDQVIECTFSFLSASFLIFLPGEFFEFGDEEVRVATVTAGLAVQMIAELACDKYVTFLDIRGGLSGWIHEFWMDQQDWRMVASKISVTFSSVMLVLVCLVRT